jgi:hypothetical protein
VCVSGRRGRGQKPGKECCQMSEANTIILDSVFYPLNSRDCHAMSSLSHVAGCVYMKTDSLVNDGQEVVRKSANGKNN